MRTPEQILDESGYPTNRTLFREVILGAIEKALEEQKIEFYKKLLSKLDDISYGHYPIEPYRREVADKIIHLVQSYNEKHSRNDG